MTLTHASGTLETSWCTSKSNPLKPCLLLWPRTLPLHAMLHRLLATATAASSLLLLCTAIMGLGATRGVGRWCSSRLRRSLGRW